MTRLPLSLSRTRAAIIDLDGTMVDTLGDFTAALHAMQHELGSRPARRAGEPPGGQRLRAPGAQYPGVGAADLDHRRHRGTFPQAMAAYQRHYLGVGHQHSRVYGGVVEGLTWLRARADWRLPA